MEGVGGLCTIFVGVVAGGETSGGKSSSLGIPAASLSEVESSSCVRSSTSALSFDLIDFAFFLVTLKDGGIKKEPCSRHLLR